MWTATEMHPTRLPSQAKETSKAHIQLSGPWLLLKTKHPSLSTDHSGLLLSQTQGQKIEEQSRSREPGHREEDLSLVTLTAHSGTGKTMILKLIGR